MDSISPWAASAAAIFSAGERPCLFTGSYKNLTFSVHSANDSVFIAVKSFKGKLLFRAAYCPGGQIEVTSSRKNENSVTIHLISPIGKIDVVIQFPEEDILRYTTTLTTDQPLVIPFWPKDIIACDEKGSFTKLNGNVHVKQVGTRSGMVFFTSQTPDLGTVLYLQNLTSLNDYCELTKTSLSDTTGGEWPEIGFSLPPTKLELPANKKVVISDAIVVFEPDYPKTEAETTQHYLDMLAKAYLQLQKPKTRYQDWVKVLDKGLHDLISNPGCWSLVKGHSYLNAYVADYVTPPEIMVQLAVLLPLQDYVEWSGKKQETIQTIKQALPTFYNEKLKTIMRWLPAAADKLEGEEEQKEPLTMDSWYLHHPLFNLSRLALKGEKIAEKLFLDSLDYAIKVAQHFNYDWPVFYKMDTLEVIKAETIPGKGGEHDVPGLYALVMLQAYELTGKKRYLKEAETAAKKLEGLGFDLFYQANNTAFSAGAMMRLFKLTRNEKYKQLSYLCIANILKNVRLWECDYGYGKNFPSFFCLFPLNDAPYTAVYEEQEVFCILHDYLKYAQGEDILPSVSLLLAEYIKHLVNRAVFYYPTMLPAEMLSEEVKTGEVDPKLWIALEDMHDGWEKSGEVGQEVYGAGNAFGIMPRHYMRVPGENFMIYTDYPTQSFSLNKDERAYFKLLGDSRLSCTIAIVKTDNERPLPKFILKAENNEVKGKLTRAGNIEYELTGDQQIDITWKR